MNNEPESLPLGPGFPMGVAVALPSGFTLEDIRYWSAHRQLPPSGPGYASMVRTAGGAQGVDPITGKPTFLGHPVFVSAKVAAAPTAGQIAGFFGDFKQGTMIGDRLPFQIVTTDHREFDRDLVTFLGRTRFDVNCHDVGNASNAGAVVALKLAAE